MRPDTIPLRRALCAALAAAWFLAGDAKPARADDAATAPVSTAGFTLAIVGAATPLVVGGLGLLATPRAVDRGWGAAWLIAGAVGVGLGVPAIVLQSKESGTCNSPSDRCWDVYYPAIAALTLGALFGGFGIAAVASPRPLNLVSRVTPVPVVIRTLRGPSVGVGLAGVAF